MKDFSKEQFSAKTRKTSAAVGNFMNFYIKDI
jgi:hypothetical protein